MDPRFLSSDSLPPEETEFLGQTGFLVAGNATPYSFNHTSRGCLRSVNGIATLAAESMGFVCG